MKRLGIVISLLVGCAGFSGAAYSEPPVAADEAAAPAVDSLQSEAINQEIEGLASVKDYQRLSSIFKAIDELPIDQRNELWKRLDERMDQLSAGGSVVVVAASEVSDKAGKEASKSFKEAAPELPQPNARPETKAVSSQEERQAFDDVSAHIAGLGLNGDMESQRKALSEATAQILTVPNQERRDQLSKQLREKHKQALEKQGNEVLAKTKALINEEERKAETQAMIDAFEQRKAGAMKQLQASVEATKDMPLEPTPPQLIQK